jgi:hypothetical protein
LLILIVDGVWMISVGDESVQPVPVVTVEKDHEMGEVMIDDG